MPSTTDTFEQWRNKQESISEQFSCWPITALSSTLDLAEISDTVPPLWHWLYFLPKAPLAEVGPDGHLMMAKPSTSGPRTMRVT